MEKKRRIGGSVLWPVARDSFYIAGIGDHNGLGVALMGSSLMFTLIAVTALIAMVKTTPKQAPISAEPAPSAVQS